METVYQNFYEVTEFEIKQFTFTGLYPLLCSMFVTLANTDDLSKVIDILYYLLTHSTYLCKLYNFIKNRRKLLDIEDVLQEKILYKYFDRYGKIYWHEVIRNCKILSYTFRLSVFLVVLFYALFPKFDKDPDRTLPLAGWFPLNMDTFHTAIYAFQIFCMAVSAGTNTSTDIYCTKLLSLAIIEIKMLKNCLRNVDYSNGNNGGIKPEELGYIVALHKHLLHYITVLEGMFTYGIFLQFLASIGVICLTGVQMLVTDPRSVQFILLIVYLICMLCQCGLYCWYGNEILTESNGIAEACYMSNWYEGTTEQKKVLFLIMERSKRQIEMTAGKFFTLNLGTYMMILKSSYSYFAVLQRVYKD
ncbi:PREDICTED: odorant receptor 4-like [Nicrophorus vespilloides]|uniref:Odorant receptor n=1 Tax=Nicrophorus vespilloides TaxID=110193 RepID=A0ABM1MHS6_NICVS|nr:PREDICTED: odorant receptor 4-like [Nicrophorus vespilloides]